MLRLIVLALAFCAISAGAHAACVPPATADIGSPFVTRNVTRLDTQTSDAVKFTGGCIEGPVINNQIYYAPAYKGVVSGALCTWDATHDVGDCINGAVVAARSGGGGKVSLPAGTYGLSTTVSQTNVTGVPIEGAGGRGEFGGFGTKLKWIGSAGATMVELGTNAASTRVVKTGLSGVYLDGNSLAAIGISSRSMTSSDFRDVGISGVTSVAWDHGVSTTADVGSTENRFYDIYIAVTGSAKGLKWSGTTANNVHHDRWYNLHIQHADGTGFECGNSDSNVIVGFYAQDSGTGLSLDLLGSAAASGQCRTNYFFAAEPQGGVTARGTSSYTVASSNNHIQINKESANIVPTVETGATLYCDNSEGNQCGSALGGYTFDSLTVTTPLPVASGGTGDTGSAWTAYTPGITCAAGTITTLGTVAGQYKKLGKTAFVEIQIPITTVGTCTGIVFAELPFTISTTGQYHFHGRDDGSAGVGLIGLLKNSVNTNKVLISRYDGTTCAASGAQCNVGGTYQTN